MNLSINNLNRENKLIIYRFLISVLIIVAMSNKVVHGINMECEISLQSWRFVSGQRCLAKLTITSQNVTLTSINGQNSEIFNQKNIKILSIHKQTFHYLPNGIEKFLPQIEALSIVASKFKSISKFDLEPFKNLQELYLQQGDVDTLSSDLFAFNPELRSVSFKTNKIQFVGLNLLEPLKKLELANFELNKCINKDASNPGEIEVLIAIMKKKCSFPREFMELAAKYKKLQTENQNLHSQLKLMESNNAFKLNVPSSLTMTEGNEEILKEMRHQMFENMKQVVKYRELEIKHAACIGNLEASIKNLFIVNHKLKSCDNPNAEFILNAYEMLKIDLNCEMNYADLCSAVDFRVKSSDATIEKVKVQDGEAIKCEKLTNISRLSIIDQQTLFLPSNLGEHFTQLIELVVTHSGLFEIDSRNFNNMKSLTSLNLARNLIQEIPAEVFSKLENLLNLDLSLNNIATIENGAFKSLTKLKSLKLNDNLLTTLNSKVFDGLVTLKDLSLRSNRLIFIDIVFLTSMPQLTSLDLTDNDCVNGIFPKDPIADIVRNITNDCVAPIEINCEYSKNFLSISQPLLIDGYKCNAQELKIVHSKTKIVKVGGVHFPGCDINNVTTFTVINQTMNFIPSELSIVFPQLETIFIFQSKLMLLQRQSFEGLVQITSITLQYNNLSFLDEGAFDDVKRVKFIDLAHNNIKQLPSRLFSKLSQLETLILSHNFLKELKSDLIISKNMISIFKADNNQIKMINPQVLKFLRNAKTIDFSSNECIDLKFERIMHDVLSFTDFLDQIDIRCSLNA